MRQEFPPFAQRGFEMDSARKIDAVVAGHLCVDVFPSFAADAPHEAANAIMSRIFVPGKLVEVGPLAVSTGGVVSNTGLALLKLGTSAVLMGKVGADAFGAVVQSILARFDAHNHLRVVEGESTSYSVVLAIPGVDRIFLHHPGSNDTFCADDVDYDLAGQAKLFHIGYPSLMRKMYEDGGNELATILRRVHELGTVTSMDMSLPDPASPAGRADWPGILAKSLPHVDIFLPSAEEMLYVVDRVKLNRLREQAGGGDLLDLLTGDDLAELAARLLAWGCKVAVIKCGHRGIYVRTAHFTNPFAPAAQWSNRELWEPVFKVDKIVGTTGAGDCSIAGFLAAFLRGLSVEQCLCYATAVGAENVEAVDAITGIRPWDETTARIEAGWPKGELDVAGDGWRFSSADSRWIGPNDGKECRQ